MVAHSTFRAIGTSDGERRNGYRALFSACLQENLLRDIRCATNRGYVLGDKGFRNPAAQQLEHRKVGWPPKSAAAPEDGRQAKLILA